MTFDVDANGILNVSARDKDTGAEQRITITESGNLDRFRGRADGRRGRAQPGRGPQLRQEVDARNELDSLAYQVERRLGELGDAAPAHEKARAELLVTDARQAVKEQAPGRPGPRRSPASCSRCSQGLLASPAAGGGDRRRQGGRTAGRGDAGAAGDDDVIDAEFSTELSREAG